MHDGHGELFDTNSQQNGKSRPASLRIRFTSADLNNYIVLKSTHSSVAKIYRSGVTQWAPQIDLTVFFT